MNTPQTRRSFIRSTTLGSLGLAGLPLLAEEVKKSAPETLVTQLFKSLNEEQRSVLCMPFDHELRSKVDNNWKIVKKSVAAVLSKEQQALVKEIFLGIHSEEYAPKVLAQVEHDGAGEAFEDSSHIAIFGEPGTGQFEFVLTGRHCTRRCDGDSVAGAAFGGPIFYGHAAEGFDESADHKGNVYWYQAKRANDLFQALDGKQRESALLQEGRAEKGTETVKLAYSAKELPGLAFSDMSKDQQGLVEKVLGDLLLPFRKQDADEVMKYIKAAGMDDLHMAFYKAGDIGNDQVWDVWQIEGPSMVWYFRGAPHVHCWAHVREPAKA